MQFTISALSALSTLLVIASAAPAPAVYPTPMEGRKLLTQCTMYGTTTMTQNTCMIPAATNCMGLGAGLTIHCEDEGYGWGSKKMPNKQTVKAKDSGLPHDVHWNVEYATGGFEKCSAQHGDGAWVQGTVGSDDDINMGHVAEHDSCSVKFNVYED